MDKETIKGLTTAAGIGLAIGSGLYFVGMAATIIVIAGQILLHCKIKRSASPKIMLINLQTANDTEAIHEINEILKDQNVVIQSLHTKKREEFKDEMYLKILIKVSEDFNTSNLICMLHNNPYVKSVKF